MEHNFPKTDFKDGKECKAILVFTIPYDQTS